MSLDARRHLARVADVFRADAGAVRVDVGAILPDGGRVRVDGGCVDRLVLGEIRYVSEVTLYVWKKKSGAGTSSGGSIRRI